MKRIEKRHVWSILVVCSAAVLIVIGSTVAFFTSKDETTNHFVGSQFDILLSETKWDPEQALNVVPGATLEKNPQVTNNERTPGYIFLRVTVPCDTQHIDAADGTPAASANVPLYKFMVLEGDTGLTTEGLATQTEGEGANSKRYYYDPHLTGQQAVHSHWSLVAGYPVADAETKQLTYVYAYTAGSALTALREGETTEPLFDKLLVWNFDESFDPQRSHTVRVEAFGIQANLTGLSISQIWSILDDGGEGS